MSAIPRSKSAKKHSKSCRNGSIETKEQSIARLSPKTKNTSKHLSQSTKPLKNEVKKKKQKSTIKSLSKLNELMETITKKLQSLQGTNGLASLISSSTKTESTCKKKIVKIPDVKQNYSTEILLKSMENQKRLYEKEKNIEIESNDQKLSKQEYENLFHKALSTPYEIYNLSVSPNLKNSKLKITALQQIRSFRKKQKTNWKQINKNLQQYLSMSNESQKVQQFKNIKQSLQKQALNNYRWVQMQNKMQISDLQKIKESEDILKRIFYKQKSIQSQKDDINMIENTDAPLGDKMILKNVDWQKYLQHDMQIQSTSDLQQIQNSESDIEYLHVKSKEMLSQEWQIQQNVDIITNWLLDQFVVEISQQKNKFFFRQTKDSQFRQEITYENDDDEEQFSNFLESVNQIASDCQLVRQRNNEGKKIPAFIKHAALELKNRQKITEDEIQRKLIKMICKRDLDVSELFLKEQDEEQYWLKIELMHQITNEVEQEIFQEQVNQLMKHFYEPS